MKKILLLTILSLLVTGCALTTEEIELAYTPQPGVATIPDADSIIVNVHVNDQRQEKTNQVSAKKNGFGMEMAPILAKEDVTVTLRKAIEQELKSRGFAIGNEALVSVTADLTRFWNDHKTGFFAGDAVADLYMEITVRDSKKKILYSRHFTTQGIEPNTQLMTGNNARLALNRSLENAMKLLFKDRAFLAALIQVSNKPAS